MQRKADKMEGICFYLPRPFVSLFESFPIRTGVFICDGEVTPNAKYAIIKRICGDSLMAQYMTSNLDGVSVPTRAISEMVWSTGGRWSLPEDVTVVPRVTGCCYDLPSHVRAGD